MISFSCVPRGTCGNDFTAVIPYIPSENLTVLFKRFESDVVISEHITKYPRSLSDMDDNQKTVLMWATETGRTDVITRALKYGVQLNAIDNSGWTAVMYAARRGNLPIMQSLLDAGCDPNHASFRDKFTALHLAAGNELIDMCNALITAGANPNKKDIDGRPACFYLKKPENKRQLEDLMDSTYTEGLTKDEVHSRDRRAMRERELVINATDLNNSINQRSYLSRMEAALCHQTADVAKDGEQLSDTAASPAKL